MSQVQVMKCDVCGKLLPTEDPEKGIHTEELDFCESCKDGIKRDLRDVKSLRAYHILIDIVAKMMAAEEEEEKKKEAAKVNNTSTSGFAPAEAEQTH